MMIVSSSPTLVFLIQVIDEFNLNPDEVVLGQGTLRPDLIESGSSLVSSHADVIKTHHNDTQLVRQLRSSNRVVEPLAEFHKDEVLLIFFTKFANFANFFSSRKFP